MPPQGVTNDEDRAEELPQDNSTPFSAPDGTQDTTSDTHPQTDINVDAHEHYDEVISGASETNDPGNRGILGYSPPDDEGRD